MASAPPVVNRIPTNGEWHVKSPPDGIIRGAFPCLMQISPGSRHGTSGNASGLHCCCYCCCHYCCHCSSNGSSSYSNNCSSSCYRSDWMSSTYIPLLYMRYVASPIWFILCRGRPIRDKKNSPSRSQPICGRGKGQAQAGRCRHLDHCNALMPVILSLPHLCSKSSIT